MARIQSLPIKGYEFPFDNFDPGLQRHVYQILLSIALATIKIQRAINTHLILKIVSEFRIQALAKKSDFLESYGLEDKYLEGRHFERSSSGVN